MSFKPVIFLAFANDKVDNAAYLRNLSAEMHGIRGALEKAEISGLCDVVIRPSASIKDIIDAFQDKRYGPRISIFHYGGHADGFSLLLEAADGSKELTHKEGLVPFLAKQENLKLVFLNGCSSEGQAKELVAAGISAVIGTVTSINDEVASTLAIRFYSSLGDGYQIEKAWSFAEDQINIAKGTSDTRALYWSGKQELTEKKPWVIRFKDGAKSIKGWNLPDVSGNALYGLPDIPPSHLPDSPFLSLNRYERKHAEVFFGRSEYIRKLYVAVRNQDAPPIILLYGPSGAGKSSLLDAGLKPRLENRLEILYLRRMDSLTLSTTLYYALLELCGFTPQVSPLGAEATSDATVVDDLREIEEVISDPYKSDIQTIINKITNEQEVLTDQIIKKIDPPKNILQSWNLAEQKLNKPILIILDQIEEAFTRPLKENADELNELFVNFRSIFSAGTPIPQGKIILSFRSEYQSQIDEYCKIHELPKSRVFLDNFTKEDVLEVLNGFKKSQKLKDTYNHEVEDALPLIVAEDLVVDLESPTSHMLQILLTKMWNRAKSISAEAPSFSLELYQVLKKEGLAIDELLHTQLENINNKYPEYSETGFVLDVLHFHCTPNSTAAIQSKQALLQRYSNSTEELQKVIEACKENFLIVELGGDNHSTMLAHDTLAKSVIKRSLLSTLPIQQSQRLLNSKMEAVRGGSPTATLDLYDLRLIESVQNYLPAFTSDELTLINKSRIEAAKKERDKQRYKYLKQSMTAVVLAGLFLTLGLFYNAKQHQKQSNINAKQSNINKQALSSTISLSRDPTNALKLAYQGMKDDPGYPEIKKSLIRAFYSSIDNHTPWYKTLLKGESFSKLIVHHGQKLVIPFIKSDSLKILDFAGKKIGALGVIKMPIHEHDTTVAVRDIYFEKVEWSAKGNRLVALNSSGRLQFYDQDFIADTVIGAQDEFEFFDISNDQDEVLSFSKISKKLVIFNFKGQVFKTINAVVNNQTTVPVNDIHLLYYLQGGQNILLTKNLDPRAEIISREGIHQAFLDSKNGVVKFVQSSRSGDLLAVARTTGTVELWSKAGRFIKNIVPSDESMPGIKSFRTKDVIHVDFHPSDSFISICFHDDMARIFNIYNNNKPLTLKHNNLVTFTRFSTEDRFILSGSSDNTASVWDMKGTLLRKLQGHTNDVTDGALDEEGDQVLTCSLDGTVRSWELQNYEDVQLLGHTGSVTYLDIDPSGKYLVSAGADHTLRLWDLENNREAHMIDLGAQGVRYVMFINNEEVLGITNSNQAFLYKKFIPKVIYFVGHNSPIKWAGVLNDHIVTTAENETRFWYKNGKLIRAQPSSVELMDIALSSVDTLAAVATNSGAIILYNDLGIVIDTLRKHTDGINYISFSPDGRYLVSSSKDRTAAIWDMTSSSVIARLARINCAPYYDCQVNTGSFSFDNKYVITTSSDRTIRIWDLKGNLATSMTGHGDLVVDAYYSPNSSMVYSFSNDRTLKLWDTDGSEINTFKGHSGAINHAIMDNRNEKIYTASDDGTIRVWLTPTGVFQYMIKTNKF
ncbi:MAG: AAA family ATPase [Saprospiraceae bacterium]|nr:AAA family ATPase [Saprospiraceae bacterium]MBP8094358.1 AAA family ATPase [Saprospiraceae bacterium]